MIIIHTGGKRAFVGVIWQEEGGVIWTTLELCTEECDISSFVTLTVLVSGILSVLVWVCTWDVGNKKNVEC